MRTFLISRKTWKACRIKTMLQSRKNRAHVSFHMPGHKRRGDDITELSYSDNLASPSGCIQQAQAEIAAVLGASAAFLLTDGSTSGVYSMLKAAKQIGVKTIAAPVLSHKSFFNGCALLGLAPVLFELPMAATPLPVGADDCADVLAEADALFLTSPDYYGNIPDLAAIAALCKRQGKLLLIDGAHGGHLHFHSALYAGQYADFWVDGVHKSLPALTQGAVVCAKSEEGGAALEEAVEVFRTSSPSYPIMASVEFAVKYPQNTWLEARVARLKAKYDCIYQNADWTKVIVFVDDGFTAAKQLEKQGVFAEFSDVHVVCFYLSPVTTKRQIRLLEMVIAKWQKKGVTIPQNALPSNHAPRILQNIDEKETEFVPLSEAEGRIVARTVGLFPPCLALAVKGECLTKEHITRLQRADNTFGLKENKILVVKG